MRPMILGAGFALTLTPAFAEELRYSLMIRDLGLERTAEALAAIDNPTPSDLFALGGVRFLAGVEDGIQLRYRVALNDDMVQDADLPVLCLPVPPNPNAEPFYPAVVEDLFAGLIPDMAASLDALEQTTQTDEVAVVVDTAHLWFDINGNGTQDQGESLFEVAGADLSRDLGGDFTPPVVRFDTADTYWLSAYAHLLSGISEAILAVDPTAAITRVTESRAAIEALNGNNRPPTFYPGEEDWVDVAAMFIHAIDGPIDADRSRAAHGHFQQMIGDNRTFWALVEQETDSDREWIPNTAQVSALPLPFPPEISTLWQAVLAEAGAVLDGDLLIPHWRLGPSAGINLAELMQNPPELDVIGMIQGETFVPYAETGRRMDGASWRMFSRMLGGDAALYAVILN